MKSKKQKQGMVSELNKKELTTIYGGEKKDGQGTVQYVFVDGKIIVRRINL